MHVCEGASRAGGRPLRDGIGSFSISATASSAGHALAINTQGRQAIERVRERGLNLLAFTAYQNIVLIGRLRRCCTQNCRDISAMARFVMSRATDLPNGCYPASKQQANARRMVCNVLRKRFELSFWEARSFGLSMPAIHRPKRITPYR